MPNTWGDSGWAMAMTLVARKLDYLLEQDVDKLLAFVQALKSAHAEAAIPALAAESALAKDWLTPGEDAAWANL